jgi:uncharacterized membrane protein
VLARLPHVSLTWPRSPRARAALCYALPLVSAFVLLLRERRSPYVRLHAARALLFFVLILLAQSALLLWLVVLGNLATARWLAVAFGLLFYLAVPILGITALVVWLRLLNDALAGRAVPPTGLGHAAAWLERRARHRDWPDIAVTDDAPPLLPSH